VRLSLVPAGKDHFVRLRCEGPITLRPWEPPRDPFRELLGPYCFTRNVLLDLEKADGIDTSGVSWLMIEHEKFQQLGGRLILYGIPPTVTQILDFLHLTPRLSVAPTEEAAMAMALGQREPAGEPESRLQIRPSPEPLSV